jgi:Tol biopolymer transport system component
MRPATAAFPFERYTVTQLTDTGKYSEATLSPDGNYLFAVVTENAADSLWLKNIPTNSATEIVPASPGMSYEVAGFSPDGTYVYFLAQKENEQSNKLLRTPVLGGTPQVVAEDVESNVSFSPDGKQIVYLSYSPQEKSANARDDLQMSNPDGSLPRTLTSFSGFEVAIEPFLRRLHWSPDGKLIALPSAKRTENRNTAGISLGEVTSGKKQFFAASTEQTITELAWSPIGNGMFVLYRNRGFGWNHQIGYLSFPSGNSSPITHDTSNYQGLSLSRDGKLLSVAQRKVKSSTYLIPANGTPETNPVPIYQQDKSFRAPTFAREGEMYISGLGHLMRMHFDGSHVENLLSDPRSNFTYIRTCWEPSATAAVLPDSRYIVFVWAGHGDNLENDEIWRADPDGSNAIRLSKGARDDYPLCSPDGKSVFYLEWVTGRLMHVSVLGGTPEFIPASEIAGRVYNGVPGISPEGSTIALPGFLGDQGWLIELLPVADAKLPVRKVRLNPPSDENSPEIGFTADGKALMYESAKNAVGNIWVQPLDRRPSYQITHFDSDQSAGFRLSPNGKSLLLVRRHDDSDVVLFRDSEKTTR